MQSPFFILGSGIIAIALLVLLIAKAKLHPFIALLISTALLGLANGLGPTKSIETLTNNFGDTLSVTGIVIALGSILGGLLLKSGGADRIADVLVGNRSKLWIPLSIAIAAVIIGLPNLFEVTFVLLVPLVYSVARRYGFSVMAVGLPMAAGLMTAHALLPPGPATVLAAGAYDASLGLTILVGCIVGIPVLLVGALLFPRLVARWGIRGSAALDEGTDGSDDHRDPDDVDDRRNSDDRGDTNGSDGSGSSGGLAVAERTGAPARIQAPSLTACLTTVLVAPVMMIVGTLLPDALPQDGWYSPVFDAVGNPVIALLVASLYAYVALGLRQGISSNALLDNVKANLKPVINVLLIVGAGGGLKGMLNAIGLSDILADSVTDWSISPILMAWVIAAVFRLALGSGTVAVAAAAGVVAPLVAGQPPIMLVLAVLATCTGAMIFSHVSDGAFWIFKEYFGLTVGETIKSWSLLVTVQAITGLACVLIVEEVVGV